MKCALSAVLFLAAIAAAPPDDKTTWGRGFIDEPSLDSPASRVAYTLTFLDSTVGHLVGEFEVLNTTSSPETINGTKTRDGKFWASVEAQITNGATPSEWKWRQIGRPPTSGEPYKLVVDPLKADSRSHEKSLFVDMDIFKPFIGKATYGRIVLPNGRWSMFELKDLLPPTTKTKGTIIPTATLSL